jgi:hypothetical protein
VKKEEVRKTGKKSSARRSLQHRKFKQSLAILERDPDPIKRFLAPCVNKVHYNLIARLDDAMELEFEDIKPNLHFPFLLLVHMCWSKNVNEERDAGKQILLGLMQREYCILLALAMYLEVWIGSGNGMLGTLLFNIVKDDPIKSKKRVADIMAILNESKKARLAHTVYASCLLRMRECLGAQRMIRIIVDDGDERSDNRTTTLTWYCITWQESSQCVTEQCRSVRPSVTCVSSVLAFAHAISHSSETTTSHLFYNQQFGATIRLSATTRRAIPTLYGVLPTV